jgi:hypothetical protein
MKVNENDVIELNDGRVVTVIAVRDDISGCLCIDDSKYESRVAREYLDESYTDTDDSEYDEPTFAVKPDQIKRIVQEFASIKDSGK